MMVFTTFSATVSVKADFDDAEINWVTLYSKTKLDTIKTSPKVGALAVEDTNTKVVKAYYVKGHKKNWYSQKKTTDKILMGKYVLVVIMEALNTSYFAEKPSLTIECEEDYYYSSKCHKINDSKYAFAIKINANEITKSGITYELKGKSLAVLDVNEKIKNAKIPERVKIGPKKYTVTKICNVSFSGAEKFKSINIPKSVKSIEPWSFYYCKKLKNINVDKKNKYYTSVDGVLFNKNKTVLIRYPAGKTAKSYTVPKGVKKIAIFAFVGNEYLKNVTIPKSVKTIDSEAFGADYGENSRDSNYTLKTITFEKGSKLKSFDLSYIGYGDYDDGFYVGKRFTHTTINCFDKRIVKMVKKKNKVIQKNYGYKNCFKIKYKK